MVTSGNTAIGVSDTVEIIDLETTKSNCANFPSLPPGGIGASGFFVDSDHPIVCGGFSPENGIVKYITIIFILFAQFGYLLPLSNLVLLKFHPVFLVNI